MWDKRHTHTHINVHWKRERIFIFSTCDTDHKHTHTHTNVKKNFCFSNMGQSFIVKFWCFVNSIKDSLRSISYSLIFGFRHYNISCFNIHVGEHFSTKF